MCMILICTLFTGARIDSAHSDNNAKRALYETLAFETAIRGALELVDASDTLVLVTADHSHSLLITGYASRHNSLFGRLILAIFFNVTPLGSRVTNTWSVWNLYNTFIGFNCRLCWQSKGQVSSKRRGVVDDIAVRHWAGLWLGTENQQNKTGAGYELHNIHFLVLKLSNAGQTLLRPNILLYEITKTFLKNLSYCSWFSKKPTDVYFYQNIFTLAVLWYKKHLLNKTSLPIVSCHFVVLESKDYIQAAASPRSSGTHDGQDVAVYARGPMSHLLTGVHEQHYINYVMTYAACVGRHKHKCMRESRVINAGAAAERSVLTLYGAVFALLILYWSTSRMLGHQVIHRWHIFHVCPSSFY